MKLFRGLVVGLAAAVCVWLVVWGRPMVEDKVRDDAPSANRALVDTDATSKVIGDVSSALVKIFSYESGDLAATETAATRLLEGEAAKQYGSLFGQVKRHAPGQRVALSTRVVRAGVISLTDHGKSETAEVLVFLDQTATRAGKRTGRTAAAQLTVTAASTGDGWRITRIRAS